MAIMSVDGIPAREKSNSILIRLTSFEEVLTASDVYHRWFLVKYIAENLNDL